MNKTANGYWMFSGDVSDALEAQVVIASMNGLDREAIADQLLADPLFLEEMNRIKENNPGNLVVFGKIEMLEFVDSTLEMRSFGTTSPAITKSAGSQVSLTPEHSGRISQILSKYLQAEGTPVIGTFDFGTIRGFIVEDNPRLGDAGGPETNEYIAEWFANKGKKLTTSDVQKPIIVVAQQAPAPAPQQSQQAPAGPVKPQVEVGEQLNERQSYAIKMLNLCFQQNFPITMDSYNNLGRGEGIASKIAGHAAAFYTFILNNKTGVLGGPRDIVAKILAGVSRGK